VALRIKIKVLFTVTLFQHDFYLYIYIYIYIYVFGYGISVHFSKPIMFCHVSPVEFRVWFNFIYLFYLCGEDNGSAGAGYAFMKLMTDLLLQVEWLANRVDGSCELLYILLEKLSYILTISTKNHE